MFFLLLDTGNHETIFVPKAVQANIRRLEKYLDTMTEEAIFVDLPKQHMWTAYITAMYKVDLTILNFFWGDA